MTPGVISKQYYLNEAMLDNVALMNFVKGNFVNARATEIDWKSKKVICEDTKEESKFFQDGNFREIQEKKLLEVKFDVLVIDVGSVSRDSSRLKGIYEYTIPTRPISKMIYKIHEFEKMKKSSFDLVVVGSGAAGIEMTCCMKNRLRDRLNSITLVDKNKGLKKSLGESLGKTVENGLKDRNIKTIFGHSITKIEENLLYLSDESTLKFDICIWACGAEPSSFLSKTGLQLDKDGWIQVNTKLQSVSHTNVFAAGDCISLENGPTLSKAGVYAVREGPILETNVLGYIENISHSKKLNLIDYIPQSSFLKIINYGDGYAVMDSYGYVLEGYLVWYLKDYIDRKFMNSFPMAQVSHSSQKEITL